MIYTVTLNPSLDYVLQMDHYHIGKLNRTDQELFYPGGKGINVSLMLRTLGVESTALGFTAGFTGTEVCRLLDEAGCRSDFIRLPGGTTRINVKIKAGEESEINARGPHIGEDDLRRLFEKLDVLKNGDILVLAGSIPAGLPDSIYEQILSRLQGREIRTVVDATGSLLMNVLKYRPFLIKPNQHELSELFHQTLEREEEIMEYARKLREMGAQNVLVSRAGDGAVLAAENGLLLSSPAPAGTVKNSVGAGDSMVAGFLTGYLKHGCYQRAFQWGLAAGSASAFSEWLADSTLVLRLVDDLERANISPDQEAK